MTILKFILVLVVVLEFSTTVISIDVERSLNSAENSQGPGSLEQTGRSRGHGSYFEWSKNHRNVKKSYLTPTRNPKKPAGGLYNFISSYFGLSQIIGKIKDSFYLELNCDSCKFATSVVAYFKASNKTEDQVMQTLIDVCITFRVQSPRVCKGIVPSFKDEFVYLYHNVEINADEICGYIVGPQCSHTPSALHTWSVHIPKKRASTSELRSRFPQKSVKNKALKVLHLSDTHFDPYYVEGSNAECGEPLCCREGANDPNLPVKKRAGRWGDYRNCDTPERTLRNMLEHIKQSHKIDYILWTGDLPPHDVWNQTRSTQLFHLFKMTKIMLSYFPDTPIFPALGNHESSPVDSFPPPQIKGELSMDWLHTQLNHTWTQWLGQNVAYTVKKGAYYSVLVFPGYRIISINTNYCNSLNWWLLVNSTDPAQELQWLVFQLEKAEVNEEKVHIIGHIPPGSPNCVNSWSKNYYNIVRRYKDIITGQFFGHNHVDEFQIFYEKLPFGNRKAINVAYIAPSTAPYTHMNPGYRIYTVDGASKDSTWKILDHETHFLNLTAANLYNSPVWTKEYSAKKDYKMEDLDPKSWDDLVFRFKRDDQLFDKYYRYYTRLSDSSPKCDSNCRWRMICDMQKATSNDYTFC